MKNSSFFDAFLADVVNLNDTRIDQLDNSFEAIKKFIRGSDYSPKLVSFYKHGSWAHRTIIRPLEGNPFDADVIMFVYRDEVYHPETEHKGIAEIIIGKQRNGPIGTTRLAFIGKYTRFENLAPGSYNFDDD